MRSVRSADESCCCAQGSRHGNLREIRVGYHTSSVAVQEISQGDQEIGTYSIQLFQVSISSNPSDTMRCDAMRYKNPQKAKNTGWAVPVACASAVRFASSSSLRIDFCGLVMFGT